MAMHPGYLLTETSATHPGLARLFLAERVPPAPAAGADTELRHAAQFNDIDMARMHAHEMLRRRLVDIDAGLYRATALEAIAAVESIGIRHRRVFLDPALAADPALARAIAAHRARRHRRDRMWRLVGIAALLFLVARLLLGF